MRASRTPARYHPAAAMEAVMRLDGVSKHYPVRGGLLRAVADVDLSIAAGTTVGVVGESGCGKTTLSRLILRQERPTEGQVFYHGQDAWKLTRAQRKDFHRGVAAVFQDPYSSLNPRHRVREIVLEPLIVNHGRLSRVERQQRVAGLLRVVGLSDDAADLYPHEFSGGQRQRIAIARAISVRPDLIVLDEPVSALDVSIRAQILNLLKDLQSELGVAYLFIAHDLAAIRHMSDQIAVMYLGSVVECAPADVLYERPLHPYTRGLLDASRTPDPSHPNLDATIHGEVPSPVDPPSGCHFRTRCPLAAARCTEESPVLRELEPSHVVACHFAQ